MKPEIEELIARLNAFALRHQEQFGLHPDSNLVLEAVRALQAKGQSDADVAEEEVPASTQVRVSRKTKGEN